MVIHSKLIVRNLLISCRETIVTSIDASIAFIMRIICYYSNSILFLLFFPGASAPLI